MGPAAAKDKNTVPALITALRDEDAIVRNNAVGALSAMGSAGQKTINALIIALKDKHYTVSNAAHGVLDKIGPVAVPALITALRGEDVALRRHAAYRLGQIGSVVKQAVLALITALTDEDTSVRRSVTGALTIPWV